jgi:DNA-binding response OmpR family regulator
VSHILIVEDDRDIADLLAHSLQKAGYATAIASTGTTVLPRVKAAAPDLILLDLMLPGMDGLLVCQALRGDPATAAIPIIMLTARGDEADRVVGLEVGADDYVVKPFSPKELVARVRALLRRAERREPEDARLVVGGLEIDPARHTVEVAGQPVHLTAKEFALLLALVEADGRVLSRQSLLEGVWGYSYAEGTRTVDVHVRRLREKIPSLAGRLITVKSLGYRLAREPEA